MEPPARPIGGECIAAIREALRQGPILAEARIYRAIVASCPDLEGSWAPGRIAKLVAAGELPEAAVAEALREVRQSLALHGPAIANRAAYAAAILKRHAARYGQAWTNGRKTG